MQALKIFAVRSIFIFAILFASMPAQASTLTVDQGKAVTINVSVSGTAPFTYQWRKDSVDIAGATSSVYSIAATTTSSAGTYTVVVSNSAGSTVSDKAVLTVNATSSAVTAPTITTQPVAQTVTEGSAATFSVVASGTSLSYQWLKNATAISGATSSSYTISATTLTDAGTYSVYIANTAGYILSNDVTLTVNSALGFAELTPSSYSARGANSTAEGVAMLFDGSIATKWVDNNAATWVSLTFAAPTVLDAYSLTSANDVPTRDPVSWTLSGSNDGVTWNVIETRTGQSWATRQLTRDFVLSTTSAAYTQFRFNFNATSGSITQLAELELYGSTVVSTKLTPSSYSARGQANKNYAIAKLFDSSASTKWVDNSATSWVKIGLKSAATLRRYTLTSVADTAKYDPVSWTLYGSNDGTNWTAIETRTGQSWSSRKLTRDFTLTKASDKYRWFRFNFQTASGYATTQLAELQLYGEQ